jgi:hypothetical protein
MIGLSRHRASRGVIFVRSAERHGFTILDALYAVEHRSDMEQTVNNENEVMIKLVGEHKDPLIPLLEIVMKQLPDGTLIIFHVAALNDNFWQR